MNSNEINKIATEALDLHKKIDLYKKRFTELKKKNS